MQIVDDHSTSHTTTAPRSPPAASRSPSGAYAKAVTRPIGHLKLARSRPLATSHSRTVWSQLPLASVEPSQAFNYTYNAASANVLNLQKRVAGVLPVRVDVPRTGTSYRFVRPLVLDEETKVTFAYKTK